MTSHHAVHNSVGSNGYMLNLTSVYLQLAQSLPLQSALLFLLPPQPPLLAPPPLQGLLRGPPPQHLELPLELPHRLPAETAPTLFPGLDCCVPVAVSPLCESSIWQLLQSFLPFASPLLVIEYQVNLVTLQLHMRWPSRRFRVKDISFQDCNNNNQICNARPLCLSLQADFSAWP